MSIPDLPPAPLRWENQPSTATPFDAEVLNPWGQQIRAQAEAARGYAVEARQAAQDAQAPTEQMVNEVLTTPGSAGRQALDDAYQTRIVINVKDHGAQGDGTTDDTAAVTAALAAAAGQVLHFPAGTYLLTDIFTVPADTIITGAGMDATILDWSTKATWTYEPLLGFFTWQSGTVGATSPLSTNLTAGDGHAQVQDGSLFRVGDFVRLISDQILWGEASQAEVHRIVQIDGDTLYLSTGAFASHTTANNGRAQKLELVTAGLHDMTIRGKGINPASLADDGVDANRGDNALVFGFVRDLRVTGVRFTGVENRCMRLNTVIGGTIQDCAFIFDPARVRLQYGVSINGASTLISIVGCHSWNDRHMVTTSTSAHTGDQPISGIPRIITIAGNTAHGSWQDPIDTHRGGEYITITGNALTTEAVGVKVRGTWITVSDNIITGKHTSPFDTVLAGVRVALRCQNVRIADNIIRNFQYGVRVDQPEGATLNLAIDGNTIVGCEQCVSLNNTLSDVHVGGNYLSARSGGHPLYLNGDITTLTVRDNTMVGGAMGIYTLGGVTLERVLIAGNMVRNHSSHGFFIRGLVDALVTGNHVSSTDGDAIRLAGANTRVTVQGNLLPGGTVVDLSSPGVDINVGANGPVAKPTGVPVTAAGIHAALVSLGLIGS